MSDNMMSEKFNNSSNWFKTTPFQPDSNTEEIWIHKTDKKEKKYYVSVKYGKPVDIISLKSNILESFKKNVLEIRRRQTEIFSQADQLENIKKCPICKSETDNKFLNVYGAQYVICPHCYHCYLSNRPLKDVLDKYYTYDKSFQKTYANKKNTNQRLKQVAMPKLEWLLEVFKKQFGRKPKSILDVGAGSGHFVQACKLKGIHSEGIELSQTGRNFCSTNFGFDLINVDFVEAWEQFKEYEVITFWGVIEHVPEPELMLNRASKILLQNKGMIVADVPRWNCLSTAIQTQYPDSISRHLIPIGHIQCFSDTSLALIFEKTGFDITNAWYYGMDAYELITQLSYALDDDNIINALKTIIPALQLSIDQAAFSDEIAFAGIPSGESL